MNVGIDIDGVLVDLRKFLIEKGKKFFKYKPINENTIDIKEMFKCTKLQEKLFWARYGFQYSLSLPIRSDAKCIIEKLKKDNNQIYIITSRFFANEKNIFGFLMRNFVKRWFNKNGIEYDEIVFCDEENKHPIEEYNLDKMDAINKYNITVMIEDNVANIKKMSDEIDVITFIDRHNAQVLDWENKKIKYAWSWEDIDYHIKNLFDDKNKLKNQRLEDNFDTDYYSDYKENIFPNKVLSFKYEPKKN